MLMMMKTTSRIAKTKPKKKNKNKNNNHQLTFKMLKMTQTLKKVIFRSNY